MDNLKESEWLVINKVLLELYGMEDINAYEEKTLKVFRMLIPYTKGYFILFNEKNEIDMKQSTFLGMDEETFTNYMEAYYEKDYLKYVFEISSDVVTYKDTEILEDTLRKKTEFYREFLRPNNIPFGAGILLIKDSEIVGIINLFRSGELGDFSDKDMYIFDVLKEHMTNITYRLRNARAENSGYKHKNLDKAVEQYGLTVKEHEVALQILEGKSNMEISEKMIISLSTVKKHVYNIYAKVGVKTRAQFIARMDKI